MTEQNKIAPGPPGFFPSGKYAKIFKKDPMELFMRINNDFGSTASFSIFGIRITTITNPSDVKYVLQENSSNYKKSITYNELKHILGQGLLTSEGSFWKRQRRISQPAFKKSMIEGFAVIVLEEIDKVLKSYENKRFTDISEDMMKITFTVVGKALFQKDLGERAEIIGNALETSLEMVLDRIQTLFKFPLTIPTPTNNKLNRAINTMKSVVDEIILERRKSGGGQGDLMDFLMFTKDEETGETMTDSQIRDEVLTFLLAGHETTSNALSWTFYLLSLHPDIRNKVREEVYPVMRTGLGYSSLENLPYTRNVIQEAMRLYPPIWIIERTPIKDDIIGGYKIPAGSVVSISINSLHKDKDYWTNPEGFDPERFNPENSAGRHGYSYLPFGGGPRICIGNHFAMMEATLILASIVHHYDLNLTSLANVLRNPVITLRPKNGIEMSLHKV
ncbi:MAG: cytochrome P450 [Spirochaetia bacterium]|nr:cytochrome P450 [Spirochaetia bacterium]